MGFKNLINSRAILSAWRQFSVPAVITQPGHPDKPIDVIFDLTGYVEQGIITDKPQICFKNSDIVGVVLADVTITVIGEYPAAKIKKPISGDGLTAATLTKA